jgi:circadian clock protein KaiC
MTAILELPLLKTGVAGLDQLVGGGIPELSVVVISGPPGIGKTTLAHQIMFSNAQTECPAVYFTTLGEPAIKMLRYQQQFGFFDTAKINQSVWFVDLSEYLVQDSLDALLDRMLTDIKKYQAKLIFVDSILSILRPFFGEPHGYLNIQIFLQKLALNMASWKTTAFFLSEKGVDDGSSELSPVFYLADGIISLMPSLNNDSMVHKIQAVKMRGRVPASGWHTYRISNGGFTVFPRAMDKARPEHPGDSKPMGKMQRLSLGVAELDSMLGGGLPAEYSLLVVGPSGSGKTIMAMQFLEEGVRKGESGIWAAFEKSPSQLISPMLDRLIKSERVGLIDTRALDLSLDETLFSMVQMIEEKQAKRVVIDSLSGFELSLAPEFRDQFRTSLYRLIAKLTGMGVTILMTSELEDRYTDLRFSPFGSAFLADAIIMLRYVQLHGELKRVMSVVKVRASDHSHGMRLYEIDDSGIVLGSDLAGVDGIFSAVPSLNAVIKDPR